MNFEGYTWFVEWDRLSIGPTSFTTVVEVLARVKIKKKYEL